MPWNAIADMLGCIETPQYTMGSANLPVLQGQQQQSTTINTSDLFAEFDCNGWRDITQPPMLGGSSLHRFTTGISRTFSCPPNFDTVEIDKVVALISAPVSAKESNKTLAANTTSNGYKRRLDANDGEEMESNSKRIKGESAGQVMQLKQEIHQNATITPAKKNNNFIKNKEEAFADSPKEASKVSEVVQKTDYIHVRARRGQATDSHSLAERIRREKISARMKYLQDLVPGCDRITGKAGMLDEIINYVQSLQRQVEFLSMKLAAVNPTFDFSPEGFFIDKENIPVFGSSMPVAAGASSQLIDPSYTSFNATQQSVTPHPTIYRTISAPVTTSDIFVDTNFDVHLAPYAWNTDLQSLKHEQLCHDILGANNPKTEV